MSHIIVLEFRWEATELSARLERESTWWPFELLLSVYSALLLISADESRGSSWSQKLLTFYVSHRYPHRSRVFDDNYFRLYMPIFLLIWISAAVLFCIFHLSSRFHAPGTIRNVLSGIIVIVGFPLACMHHAPAQLFLQVELAIAIACLGLFVYKRWPVSWPLNVLLLVLHYGLWTLFSGNPFWASTFLLWPGWRWIYRIGPSAQLISPVLGLSSALVWGTLVKRSHGFASL